MDFFEHQERARRKTGLLIVYFALAVVLIIISVYLAVAGILFYGQSRATGEATTLWFPEVFLAVSAGTVVIVAVGSLVKIAELSSGGEGVARALGGRPVDTNTRDLRERVLLNVVEEMSIASGTPVPPVYLLDHEKGINAFAAGTTPQNAVIGVTRGTIETLKRDELQGVIAHEFSHILNGDMRLNIRLIGLLSGILLISTIGYILMRTSSSSSYFADSHNKKGGNPLPLLGLCLYVIGYVGVFFGHLIKSAVSRQREFLADASAVQFTRLASGIAGALKKIGGLVYGSRLQSPRAEEASHMYFGNGLAAPFLDLLATHPPLAERIRRIDPQFDGQFAEVGRVQYTEADLVDPSTLAARREAQGRVAGGVMPPVMATVAAGAAAGAASYAFEPEAAVAQVGAPQSEHLDYAADLVTSLPERVAQEIRDPLGAVATVYSLLLDDDEPDVHAAQLDYLATQADPRANAETLRIADLVSTLRPEAKLPVVGLTVPALVRLSPAQLAAFHETVNYLVGADKKTSMFEYGVQRLVQKRLLPRLEHAPEGQTKYATFSVVDGASRDLLSALAYCGTRDDAQAAQAFSAGAAKLPDGGAGATLLSRDDCNRARIDAALDRLADATPKIKRAVISACAECIGADGYVTVEEGELLRIVSDALECPMPPWAGAK